MLSIILASENFKYFVFNRHFIIYTDHKPITSLFGGTISNHRLFRWKLYLSQFDFEIIYKKGTANVVADFLSRMNNTPDDGQPNDEPSAYINAVQTRAQTEATKNQWEQKEEDEKPNRFFYSGQRKIL